MVKDLEETRLENLCQGNLQKYVGRPLQMGKNVKIFVSHVIAYQRMTSAEKNFNNQVDKMT